MHRIDPVCSEPKVFVGQVPLEATEEQVFQIFSQHGVIKNCALLMGPDHRSRGAAMVLFERWAEAERAAEAENGTLNLGGTKPLVVRIADVRGKGNGPISGIYPKKLFVGQIPVSMTEAELHSLLAPHGNIVELALLKKNANAGAACAFVTYERWAQCEAAIDAHNGLTHLEGAKMPMVVKFADAKPDGMNSVNSKRPFHNNMEVPGPHNINKKQFLQHGMRGGFNAYGFDMNAMAAMAQMGNMGGMGYNMGHMGGMSMSPMARMMGMGGTGMTPTGMQGGACMPSTGMSVMNNTTIPSNNSAMSNRTAPRISEEAKLWKLFVGQVPFEASEQDLWPVFSDIGNILELVILRNPMGQSRGCAFITYESRASADSAVQQINGKVYLPNDPKQRVLIVKYATPGSGNNGGGNRGSMGLGVQNLGQGMPMAQGAVGIMSGMMGNGSIGNDSNSMMVMGGSMMGGMGAMGMTPEQAAYAQQAAAYSQQQGFGGYPGQY